VKYTVAWPFPPKTEPMVGASGYVAGSTKLLATDAVLVPISLTAITVKKYVTPLVKPSTIIGEALPVAICNPSFDVTT